MSQLEVIVGRISLVGESMRDMDVHTYNQIELDTPSGRVDLPNVFVAAQTARPLKLGRDVRILVLKPTGSFKGKLFLMAIYDEKLKRTFSDERLFDLRASARNKALIYSALSIVMLPILFLAYVLPAIGYIWLLIGAWKNVNSLPDIDTVAKAVGDLEPSS